MEHIKLISAGEIPWGWHFSQKLPSVAPQTVGGSVKPVFPVVQKSSPQLAMHLFLRTESWTQWEIAFNSQGVGLWMEHLTYTYSIDKSKLELQLKQVILGKEDDMERIDADFQEW